MALETLNGITEIGGFKVVRDKPEGMSWDDFDKMRLEYPINITDRVNCISFRIQNGPIKEVGVNGCQVDTIIEAAKLMIEKLNEKYPCSQNDDCIASLDQALEFLAARKANRIVRGVEGTSNT